MGRMVDMTEGRPTKQMLVFAVPLIAGNVGQQLYIYKYRLGLPFCLCFSLGRYWGCCCYCYRSNDCVFVLLIPSVKIAAENGAQILEAGF